MPRKILIRSREHVYHITSRSNSKEWFYLPKHEVWKICLNLLKKGERDFKIEIHAFVLMSNHYHLMVRFPHCDIDKFMHFFNKMMSIRINQSAGHINHVFGRPYKWSVIKNSDYYFSALKYLYQNPLRAGLCKKVEDYAFSTLPYELENICAPFQLNSFVSSYGPTRIKWLNQIYAPKREILIKKAFRRAYFTPGTPKEM